MKTLKEFLEEYNTISYDEIENSYGQFLDICYDPAEIAGRTIKASDMRDLNPDMFRCGVSDYAGEWYTEHCGRYYVIRDFNQAKSDFNDQEELEAI